MKKIYLLIGFMMCMLSLKAQEPRTILFDNDWRFMKGSGIQAEAPAFDDDAWRKLNLPHDWSIEDLPNQIADSIMGPFSKASIGKMGTGYTVGGTAWYRKKFTIDAKDKDKTVYLQFDGVYMNADVWVNGKHLGNHPYGYTSFYYDITPFLNPAGQINVVAVQVKNEGRNARWYSGSGIYRHTWLTLVNPVHIPIWGVYVTTPNVSEKSAEIEVLTSLRNAGKKESPVNVKLEIVDPSGKVVATSEGKVSIGAESSCEIKQKAIVSGPALWSLEKTNLYQARITVAANGKVTDQLYTVFGIRSLHFDAKSGFTLNGKSIELKGGCFHHDNGPLGSAAIDRAEERKIELLKRAGYNAIRCSHNPPSPYLLQVCDRLGMLVVDEFTDMWEKSKISADDYSKYFSNHWKDDLTSIIFRDRNHPSVIMWSIGNEIPEAADTSGLRIAKNLSALVRLLDPTRPVTEAMVDFSEFMTGKSGWDKQTPHMDQLGVVGYNYRFSDYKKDHEKYPNRIMMATEFMPPLSLQNWNLADELPYVIGNFSWTAMDYLGEAGTGIPRLIDTTKNNKSAGIMDFFNQDSWPAVINYQGDLDLVGYRKPASYYQQVVWRNSPVEMFVHRPIPAGNKELVSPWGFPDELKSWNWPGHEGEKLTVNVYTRSPLVKLELNGKTIGEKSVDGINSITASFEVPYEPGTLIAHCFANGKETASQTIKTVGKPASIRLVADRSVIRSDENDLSYVRVEIMDEAENIVPYLDDLEFTCELTGDAVIAGIGNGNPIDVSSYHQNHKKVFQGKGLIIIRPIGKPGNASLKVTANGVKESEINITIK